MNILGVFCLARGVVPMELESLLFQAGTWSSEKVGRTACNGK
jgi:hypothetical protein